MRKAHNSVDLLGGLLEGFNADSRRQVPFAGRFTKGRGSAAMWMLCSKLGFRPVVVGAKREWSFHLQLSLTAWWHAFAF